MAVDIEMSTVPASEGGSGSDCDSCEAPAGSASCNENASDNEDTSDTSDEEAGKRQSCCPVMPCYMWPLLVMIDGVHAASMDAWLPNLLRVQEDFNVASGTAALTVQCGLLASALGSAVVGPLADHVGRRKAQMLAFSLYLAGALVGAVAPTFNMLLTGRMLLGLGQGGQMLGQVFVRDLVEEPGQRLQTMATLASLSPLVNFSGPIIGGAIGSALGWRWVCGFQVAWGATVVLGAFVVPESIPRSSDEDVREGSARSAAGLVRDVSHVVQSRIFVGAAGVFGLMFATIVAMLTLLPFVLEEYFGLPASEAGGLMGMVSFGVMAGSFLSLLLGKCVRPLPLLRGAMLPFLAAIGLNVALAGSPVGLSHAAWWPVLLSAFLLVFAMGVFGPICQAMYLGPFREIAGTAAGTAALTQTIMMTVGSAIASQVWQRDPHPRTFFIVLAGGMLVVQLWFWAFLGLRHAPPEPQGDGKPAAVIVGRACGGKAADDGGTNVV